MKTKIVAIPAKQEHGMTSAVEARNYIDALIDERQPLKAALPRLAARIGIGARRLRALRNGEARRVEADEIRALQAATIKKQVSDAAKPRRPIGSHGSASCGV